VNVLSDAARRRDFVRALNTINGLLTEAVGEPKLDKERTLRLLGNGMSLLLGLAAALLGGDPEEAAAVLETLDPNPDAPPDPPTEDNVKPA